MKVLLLTLPICLLLSGCFFQKKSTTRKVVTNTKEETTTPSTPNTTDPSYPTTTNPETPDSGIGISPYSFLITGHGKGYYSSGIVWSTDPELQSVQSRSKFNTDYRLKIRLKALDRPQQGYQTQTYDNYNNLCQRADYVYSKIKVLIGIRAIGSTTYLEKKYVEANINSFSGIIQFTPPSASNFIVDVLELKNDSWCKTYTESGYADQAEQLGYCPFAEETSFSCSQFEIHMATDWTTDFY